MRRLLAGGMTYNHAKPIVAGIRLSYRALELQIAPVTTEQLVRYAGAANDYARIHYDLPYASGCFTSVNWRSILAAATTPAALAGFSTNKRGGSRCD
ncbi:MAG: hypothetical protein Q8K31_04340 [Burkholderiaceae bacterium]|nr:hypothetical protein [Burkholderiaceae bacterium]MDO9089552.1 hypothetical protein [Burkholderiaceae bacterium]MDP1968396.1 hypothetical protein [Burkholderiaceae bacterium]